MREGTVSFVIPARNAATTLRACLDAVLAACVPEGWTREVLLVDNGSTDRTVAIGHERGVLVVEAPDRTVGAVRNAGAREARGDVLAFVDADCVIAPDWLERALPLLDDPVVGAAGAPTHVPEGATWVQRAWALHRHRRRGRQPVGWLPTENLLVQRRAFQSIAGFNETLVTCEDVDFCYRLGEQYRILSDPAIRSIHLGEAPTLRVFYRKERWRATGNLRGLTTHSFRLAELPSALLPGYHAAAALGSGAGLVYGLVTGRWAPAAAMATLLLAPSALAALRTAIEAGRLGWWPRLLLLYLTYAAARAGAMLGRDAPDRQPQALRL